LRKTDGEILEIGI